MKECVQRVSKVLFLTGENKIHIFKPPTVIFFLSNIDKSIVHHFSPTICTNTRERARNDIIKIPTGDGYEKYATRVPNVVLYEFYEYSVFSSKTPLSIEIKE